LTPALREGAVVVRADTDGVVVTIDGAPAVLGRNTVNPGAHQVRVAKEGHKTWEAEVRVLPGSTLELVAHLPRAEIPPMPSQRPLKTWRWVALGATVVAGALGTVAYARAYMDRSRAQSLNGQDFETQEQFRAAYDREQRSASRNTDLGRIALVATAAAGAAAVALFLVDRRHASERTVGLAPVSGGMMATFGVSF
jgi:hypothetical protein